MGYMNVNSDTCDSQIGISYYYKLAFHIHNISLKHQFTYFSITRNRQTRNEQEHTSWNGEGGGATVARSCAVGGRALVAGLVTQSHIADG